jgi:hypothetical protein
MEFDMSDLLPSDEDIQLFKENGFYTSKVLFTDEELDLLIQAQDNYYNDPTPYWPYKKMKPYGWKFGEKVDFKRTDYSYLQIPQIRDFIMKPIIGDIAAALLGEKVKLWNDHLSLKEPHAKTTTVGWHRDDFYWESCTAENLITAWVPFHEIKENSGGLQYIKGSNNWPKVKSLDYFSKDLEEQENAFASTQFSIEKVAALLKRGQVTFHTSKTAHCSYQNESDIARRGLGIHMQPRSNQFKPDFFHINKVYIAKKDGDFDYDDQLLFPHLGS